MSYGPERERWFAFRSERLRTFMEAWLSAHAIKAIARPAWSDTPPGAGERDRAGLRRGVGGRAEVGERAADAQRRGAPAAPQGARRVPRAARPRHGRGLRRVPEGAAGGARVRAPPRAHAAGAGRGPRLRRRRRTTTTRRTEGPDGEAGWRRTRGGGAGPAAAPAVAGRRRLGRDAAHTVVDRAVVRFFAPETGGTAHPRFVLERTLAFEARLEAMAERGGRRRRATRSVTCAPRWSTTWPSRCWPSLAEKLIAESPAEKRPALGGGAAGRGAAGPGAGRAPGRARARGRGGAGGAARSPPRSTRCSTGPPWRRGTSTARSRRSCTRPRSSSATCTGRRLTRTAGSRSSRCATALARWFVVERVRVAESAFLQSARRACTSSSRGEPRDLVGDARHRLRERLAAALREGERVVAALDGEEARAGRETLEVGARARRARRRGRASPARRAWARGPSAGARCGAARACRADAAGSRGARARRRPAPPGRPPAWRCARPSTCPR